MDNASVDSSVAAPPPTGAKLPQVTKLLATAPLGTTKLVIQYWPDHVILRGTPSTAALERSLLTRLEVVQRELEPQVWSTKQPWAAERIAAMRAKIGSTRK